MQDVAALGKIERMRTGFPGAVGHELRAPPAAVTNRGPVHRSRTRP